MFPSLRRLLETEFYQNERTNQERKPEKPKTVLPTQELLLLLSHFSRVRLCATPKTAAHLAPPPLGFSRQEHWNGWHFLLQCMKVKSESEVAQLCPTFSDPMDCSPQGSSFHGSFQARALEWGASAFSANPTEMKVINMMLMRGDLRMKLQVERIIHSYWSMAEGSSDNLLRRWNINFWISDADIWMFWRQM